MKIIVVQSDRRAHISPQDPIRSRFRFCQPREDYGASLSTFRAQYRGSALSPDEFEQDEYSHGGGKA